MAAVGDRLQLFEVVLFFCRTCATGFCVLERRFFLGNIVYWLLQIPVVQKLSELVGICRSYNDKVA